MDVAAATASTQAIQSTLQALTALQLTAYLWPSQTKVTDGDTFDFIVVGGGTAGCTVANRLTEIKHLKVLVIEAGTDPPLESVLPGLFFYLPNSRQDWNYSSQNDEYAGQLLKNNVFALTSGKMLGGSSSLDHMINVRGYPEDYRPWAEAASDDSWGWNGIYPYFIKSEKLEDVHILDSPYRQYHGTKGYLKVAREKHKEVLPYLNAFQELGNHIVLDINGNHSLGYTQPLLSVYGGRQSNAYAYLTPIKNRTNLYILKNSLVTRIIFEGNIAVGVEVVMENNDSIKLKAIKEIILTAGVFNSPKLLMLSGIGPKKHLQSLGIKVMSDLPVGENLHDHIVAIILHKMEKSQAPTPPTDPAKFPAPAFVGFGSLNKSQTLPDYLAINALLPHDSQVVLLICSNVFSYQDEICQTVYEANKGRNILFTVLLHSRQKSQGKVLLRSTNPTDAPLVYTGAFSDKADLVNGAKNVQDFIRVINTTYFKSVDAELVNFKIPQCAHLEFRNPEYWQCYTLSLSGTSYCHCCTNPIGTVVDSQLYVKGVKGLRVADASVMPTITSGDIKAAVIAIAEKAADIIKASIIRQGNEKEENQKKIVKSNGICD